MAHGDIWHLQQKSESTTTTIAIVLHLAQQKRIQSSIANIIGRCTSCNSRRNDKLCALRCIYKLFLIDSLKFLCSFKITTTGSHKYQQFLLIYLCNFLDKIQINWNFIFNGIYRRAGTENYIFQFIHIDCSPSVVRKDFRLFTLFRVRAILNFWEFYQQFIAFVHL